jgi:predicted MFS family arabinose efflux permease
LTVLGVAGFAAHPAARAFAPADAGARERGGALRGPGVRALVLVFGLVGTTFGAIEVAVPAATDAGTAGALLALWGAGSLVGGLIVARTAQPADTARRLRRLLVALAAGHLLLLPATGPLALAALLPIAGLAIAPTFTYTFALVEDLAPRGTLTEAYTWLSTGIGGGIAAGAALAGLLAQHEGATAAFGLAAAAAAAGAAMAAVSRLRPAP